MPISATKDAAPISTGPRYFHIGAQNDALFIISGRAPAMNNDYPVHDADRTCIAAVYDQAEANRLVDAANAALRSRDCKIYSAGVVPLTICAPDNLSEGVQKQMQSFATALASKMFMAEVKFRAEHGHDFDVDEWREAHWKDQCLAGFKEHLAKGDPIDIAAYCLFMHYHGWSTTEAVASRENAHD